MLPEASSSQYRDQQAISGTTAAAVSKLWSQMGDDFDESWAGLRPQMVNVVETGRRAAVAVAAPYTSRVLAETGQAAEPIGRLNLDTFLESAPDGRSIPTLYDQAVVKSKLAVRSGLSTETALFAASQWLSMTTLTTLADTRRMVYGADIIQRPTLTGYTRMLNGPSCKDCIVLAGKWFRWNEGFERHPNCDCIHIATAENVEGDARTDPYEMFKSMTPKEQEKTFGRSESRALREGADIYKVVNQSNRRLKTANSAIDKIYRNAGTRTNAVKMLREQGFILERGQVIVPLSPGVRTDAQIIAGGRGRGTVTVAGDTVTTNRAAKFDAAAAGERDPLRRSTMTAAERRLYDAHYRLDYALKTGNWPRSVGRSSADTFAQSIPLTPAALAELRENLRIQVALLDRRSTPESVRRLARLLGL